MHEWSYSNDYEGMARRMVPHVGLKERFKKLDIEVELGFTAEQAAEEVERCLNCDIQDMQKSTLLIPYALDEAVADEKQPAVGGATK